jgi:hypothetical protein
MCENENIELCELSNSCPNAHINEDTRDGIIYHTNEESEDTIIKDDENNYLISKSIKRKFSSPISYGKEQRRFSKQVHTPIKCENNLRYSFNDK